MSDYVVSLEYVYVEDMEGTCCVPWYTNVLCVVCVSDESMNVYHVSLGTLYYGSGKTEHSWELYEKRSCLTGL